MTTTVTPPIPPDPTSVILGAIAIIAIFTILKFFA